MNNELVVIGIAIVVAATIEFLTVKNGEFDY